MQWWVRVDIVFTVYAAPDAGDPILQWKYTTARSTARAKSGKLILRGVSTGLGQMWAASSFLDWGAVGGHVQGSGRSHEVEKEAKEKQAEGEIRSADSAFCLLAMPTPSYV